MQPQRTIATICPSCGTHFRTPVADDDPINRFWRSVNRDGPVPDHVPELGPCWIWTDAINDGGYGRANWTARAWTDRSGRAHRIAFELTNGPVPKGLFVLHRCDRRACVNPDHLFLGTKRDNMQDMHAKKRNWQQLYPDRIAVGLRNGAYTKPHRVPRGERNGMAKLTPREVKTIRASFVPGSRTLGSYALGRQYGVSGQTIRRIVNGQLWASLLGAEAE